MDQNETVGKVINIDQLKDRKVAHLQSLLTLPPGWQALLAAELAGENMQKLWQFLATEKKKGKNIFPRRHEIFAALQVADFPQVRVVILGQDPYHGSGQAHGLSFSVRSGVSLPPSLVNIFKELESDLAIPRSKNGDLTPWAQQGVLLLNSVLTVEESLAASHQGKGWEEFTDKIIQILNAKKAGIVFVLWGSYAQKKAAFVDQSKHLVLRAPHPSPLSSHRGFFGSKPFSQINQWLLNQGQKPINWQLP